jgi:hypothetical protein
MASPEPLQQVEPRGETLPIIAYKGGFELLDAKWDLSSGRTVKFRLMEEPRRPLLTAGSAPGSTWS